MKQPSTPLRLLTLCTCFILAFSVLFASSLRSRLFQLATHSSSRPITTLIPIPLSATNNMAFETELKVAQLAVQRAAILTKKVFHETAKGTVSKDDKSPVTIGDFGAQALIIAALKHSFPQDEVVGEEEASLLRHDTTLSSTIWQLVKDVHLDDAESDQALGGPLTSESAMLSAIDHGKSSGGATGRIWALDPIDGTKGFLRGGQYAICLALIIDGHVRVGVLGCPNLPTSNTEPLASSTGTSATDSQGHGVLFFAAQGQGSHSRPLTTSSLPASQPIHVSKLTDASQASFCESVEPGHSSQGDNAAIASLLKITRPPVRMDSQAKYGSVARAAADVYLRLPVQAEYVEKIWDHAAGDLIVREAGGVVTDIEGQRLDFSQGQTLTQNKGVIATAGGVHAEVLKAVRQVLEEKRKKSEEVKM